jgi:hypothetical protein
MRRGVACGRLWDSGRNGSSQSLQAVSEVYGNVDGAEFRADLPEDLVWEIVMRFSDHVDCIRTTSSGEVGSTMIKGDLVEDVSRAAEMTWKGSEVIVDAIFDSIDIRQSLHGGDKIEIRVFGNFPSRQRP